MFIMILLFVMLSFLSGGSARVVDDFIINECGDFFYNEITPTVLPENNYKKICQTLYNKAYYATLYDTVNKIPVYSAYKFEGLMQCERLANFFIEPQLDFIDESRKNMETDRFHVLENQAVNADYKNSGYDRGHLAPVYHASSQKCADATFTLTNAAPQCGKFNKLWFNRVERKVADTLKDNCKDNTAYIVTGVVPGFKKLNNRVKVPSHFWTAYCCTRHTNNQLMSGGAILYFDDQNPELMPVRQLEERFKNLSHFESFYLFDNNCGDAEYVEVKT